MTEKTKKQIKAFVVNASVVNGSRCTQFNAYFVNAPIVFTLVNASSINASSQLNGSPIEVNAPTFVRKVYSYNF